MEPLIRHVRFFNGQFLRQEEFNEEQGYANHMRRRLNYALFEDGVVEISGTDLTIERENPTDPTNKRVRVRRGMAVGANSDVLEGREIILREDTAYSNLSTVASAGQVVYVTANFLRTETTPVAVGSSTENSRVAETAEVRYHPRAAADPIPTGMFVGQDPMILLGSIDFSSMGPGPQCRQVARLRSSLFAPAPGISISPSSVTLAATPVTMTLTITPSGGLNLSTLTTAQIAFSSMAGISGLTVLAGTAPDGARQVQFVLAPGSTAGTRTITISIPGFVPVADDFSISAFVAAPTITLTGAGAFPSSTTFNAILEINGTNFVGTVRVRFNNPGVDKTTFGGPGESLTATQIRLRVPATGVATGTITVFADGGPVTSPSINIA
jgi:hypothetical protein